MVMDVDHSIPFMDSDATPTDPVTSEEVQEEHDLHIAAPVGTGSSAPSVTSVVLDACACLTGASRQEGDGCCRRPGEWGC